MEASGGGHTATVQALIEAGAELNQRDKVRHQCAVSRSTTVLSDIRGRGVGVVLSLQT
jgi:ankyrin repeat protein